MAAMKSLPGLGRVENLRIRFCDRQGERRPRGRAITSRLCAALSRNVFHRPVSLEE